MLLIWINIVIIASLGNVQSSLQSNIKTNPKLKFNTFFSTMVKKCSSCKYVGYCNVNCQQLAWPVHKKECKSIQNFSGKLTDHIRLTARIIQKLKKNIDREKFFNLDASKFIFYNNVTPLFTLYIITYV